MKPCIGFFLIGNDPAYHLMAARMVASAKRVMPGIFVDHFTDTHTKEVEGVDKTFRTKKDRPMALMRMYHHAAQFGEWIFVDCDVIFQRDVREVFDDKEFDVALTDREGTITFEGKYAEVMPFNTGVAFSRNKKFWYHVATALKTLPLNHQQWCGDQLIINAMVKAGGAGFRIKVIPGIQFNFPPRSVDDPLIEQASIVHCKGPSRKPLYMPIAQRLGL